MMKRLISSTMSLNLGLLLIRLPVGAYMFLAGFNKVFSVGVQNFVDGSARLLPRLMPETLGRGYLYAFPFFELILGSLIVLGLFTRISGLLNSLLLLSIIIAQGITGGAGPFHHATVLLGASLLLALAGPGEHSLDHTIRGRRRGGIGERR
jgi:uncharacterized membrane protein YphA (DoxX/SURF4 family)